MLTKLSDSNRRHNACFDYMESMAWCLYYFSGVLPRCTLCVWVVCRCMCNIYRVLSFSAIDNVLTSPNESIDDG